MAICKACNGYTPNALGVCDSCLRKQGQITIEEIVDEKEQDEEKSHTDH